MTSCFYSPVIIFTSKTLTGFLCVCDGNIHSDMASLPFSEESLISLLSDDEDHVVLELEVPTRLFIGRRVLHVLWEIIKVAVVQRSVHLVKETRHQCCGLRAVTSQRHGRITHRGRERRVDGSQAEAVPVEAFKPPEGQRCVAMTTVSC